MSIKSVGKSLLSSLLEYQAKRLLNNNDLTIIAVGGSVGKTSTKLAIAKTIASWAEVIYQDGNYNDRLTVPLVLFNQTEPQIFNVWAWLKILISNEKAIKQTYPYKYAVLEIGTDGPNQLQRFSYLQPDLYVLTAISEEHMEYFLDLDSVAKEELSPLAFSKQALVNLDAVGPKNLIKQPFMSYAETKQADYIIKQQADQLVIRLKDGNQLTIKAPLLGRQGAMIVLAAAAVNHWLGLSLAEIRASLASIEPVPGRMQLLKGIKHSQIIDDTYNSSPLAATAALDVLYGCVAKPKIAVLGSMNELGSYTESAHRDIGAYCDPKRLDLVITVGEVAKKYLAPAARQNHCEVISFLSPYQAGQYLKDNLKANSVILFKGSQNAVFCEEAIKPLLLNAKDSAKLVRQSKTWLKLKAKQFSDLTQI
jgi:UDP-N-acetylmuramoyl-tripeptide--D-alanyl-D-alanine ligase